MGGGVTVEGVSSALLYTVLILISGGVLWRHKELRLFISLLWIANVADIIPQVLVSSQNGYVPEWWLINYTAACLFFAIEYRRRRYDIMQLASVCYWINALCAFVCVMARYSDMGQIKAGQALAVIHVTHWVIGAYLAVYAFADLYKRFAVK